MITYNFDSEFAWKHIQRDDTPSLTMAYREAFDIDVKIAKDDKGIYLAVEDGFETLFKEYVFDLDDLKASFDKCIDMMRKYKV